MVLFSCKFEATIGGDSGQQRAQNNNQANNQNPQRENEPNERPPNNENQPDNPVNPDPPNNENRQPNNPEPENPDHQNNGNPPAQPNNPENPDRQNRGNRHPKTPGKTDPDNKGNRHPNSPENADPENNGIPPFNSHGNPALPNCGTGVPQLYSIANMAAPKPLFVKRGDSTPTLGVPVDGKSSPTLKRSAENMTAHYSKLQKLNNQPGPLGHCFSNLTPENGLRRGRDQIHRPFDFSNNAQAPRNNGRFYSTDRNIIIMPTINAINEQIKTTGNYEVWNLSVRHKDHGEVVFLGSRDLSKVEPDLSKLVVFSHGNFTLGPNIVHDPVMCTLKNITRADLAKQVSRTGNLPDNDELYRILTALAIVVNAKCWAYDEKEKEWTFLTSPSEKGNCKQGGQSRQEQNTSNDDDDDDDFDDDQDGDYVDKWGR